jgi:hypothetical protein
VNVPVDGTCAVMLKLANGVLPSGLHSITPLRDPCTL